MALQLNLLHEEFSEERQRKRDPLKLGVIALSSFGLLLFLYYGWNAYQTIQIKRELGVTMGEWQKVEPKVTAAQKRATELHQIIDSTKVLDGLIDQRFYWAPFLSEVAQCVAPNLQITGLDGNLVESDHSIAVSLEGLAAAQEPRAAAEEFRQLLTEQLEKHYTEVKVTFRNLEDLDTVVNLAGAATPSARFVLAVSFLNKQGTSSKTEDPTKAVATTK
ncbi:MAG: hypothetical protein ACR2G0_10030 [Chthoniobacterales bacterium]